MSWSRHLLCLTLEFGESPHLLFRTPGYRFPSASDALFGTERQSNFICVRLKFGACVTLLDSSTRAEHGGGVAAENPRKHEENIQTPFDCWACATWDTYATRFLMWFVLHVDRMSSVFILVRIQTSFHSRTLHYLYIQRRKTCTSMPAMKMATSQGGCLWVRSREREHTQNKRNSTALKKKDTFLTIHVREQ